MSRLLSLSPTSTTPSPPSSKRFITTCSTEHEKSSTTRSPLFSSGRISFPLSTRTTLSLSLGVKLNRAKTRSRSVQRRNRSKVQRTRKLLQLVPRVCVSLTIKASLARSKERSAPTVTLPPSDGLCSVAVVSFPTPSLPSRVSIKFSDFCRSWLSQTKHGREEELDRERRFSFLGIFVTSRFNKKNATDNYYPQMLPVHSCASSDSSAMRKCKGKRQSSGERLIESTAPSFRCTDLLDLNVEASPFPILFPFYPPSRFP